MATVIVNHKVEDYATWKPAFDADKERRTGGGINEIAVGEKQGEPNNVYMIWDVKDASIISAMMADADLQQRMKDGGVISVPEVIVLQ